MNATERAIELFVRLRATGVELFLAPEGLRYRATAGAYTPALRAEVDAMRERQGRLGGRRPVGDAGFKAGALSGVATRVLQGGRGGLMFRPRLCRRGGPPPYRIYPARQSHPSPF